MFNALLKWVGKWLLGLLVPILDPEDAQRAQELLAKSKTLDAAEQALVVREDAFHDRMVHSDQLVQEWQQKTVELDNTIAELGKKFAADTEVRKGLEDDLQKKMVDIDSRPAIDRTERPLPGTDDKSS